jgi:hypothetical protein
MPHEVVVADVDDLVAEGEVEGATEAGVQAVNDVEIGVGDILGRREGGKELLEDGGGQGAERVAAVKQDALALGSRRGLVDLNDVAIGLVDRDAVDVNPVAGEAIGRRGSGDYGALDEVARVLLDVEAAEDDGS